MEIQGPVLRPGGFVLQQFTGAFEEGIQDGIQDGIRRVVRPNR